VDFVDARVCKKKCTYVKALSWAKGIFLTVGSQEYTPYWQITPPSDQNVKTHFILLCNVLDTWNMLFAISLCFIELCVSMLLIYQTHQSLCYICWCNLMC